MKKIVAVLLGALLAVGALAGMTACGDGENRTELKVLNYRVEDKDFYKWFEREFEAEYTDIDLVYESVDTANYSNLLTSRLTGGQVDVFGSQPPMFFTPNVASKMKDISSLPIWEGMYDFVLDECTNNGKRYIAPTSVVAGVVFYNKKLFAAAGVTTLPTTWNEFLAVCEKLETHLGVSTEKAPIVSGLLEPWPVNILVDTLEANAVRGSAPDFFYDLAVGDRQMNDPLVTDLMTKLSEVSQYFQTGPTGLQSSMVPGRFSTGNYGMMIDGSWQLMQIRASEPDFEVGTFMLPSNDDKTKNQNLCYKCGGGYSICTDTQFPEGAQKFIEFHMRKDVQQKYADMCKMGTTSDDIEIKDELAKEFYSNPDYTYVFLAENMFVRGMFGYPPADMVELVQGRKNVAETVALLQQKHESAAGTWSSYAGDWIKKYYPDKLKGGSVE